MTSSAHAAPVQLSDERYERIRAACAWAADYIDLDAHAAAIAQTVHRATAGPAAAEARRDEHGNH